MRTYVTDMPNGDQPGGRSHLCTQTYVRSANLLTQADAHVRTYGHTYVGARGGACNAQSGTPLGPDTYVRTYVRCKFGGVATARERVARERERVGESLTIIINDDDSSSPSSSYVFRRFWSSHLVL